MRNPTRWLSEQPHLLLVLTMLIWSGNAVAGKFAVGHISPMVLTLARWTFTIVVVGFLARKHIRADWAVIRVNAVYLLLMGATGYTLFNVLLYSALHHTTAINVAIEQAAIPAVIFVANLILFRIAAHWLQIIGFGLAFVGVLLTVTAGDLATLSALQLNRGDTLMVGAIVSYGLYSVALRAKPQLHWMSFFASLSAGAFLTAIPAAIWEVYHGSVIWPVTLQGALVALYAAIFPSILAQQFYIRGIEKLGANAGGMYVMLLPFFTIVLAVLLVGEQFGPWHALALVLVTGGIFVAQRVGRNGSRTPPASGS